MYCKFPSIFRNSVEAFLLSFPEGHKITPKKTLHFRLNYFMIIACLTQTSMGLFLDSYLWLCYLRQSVQSVYLHPRGIFVCPAQQMLLVLCLLHRPKLSHNPKTKQRHTEISTRIQMWHHKYYLLHFSTLPYGFVGWTCKTPYVHSIL